LRARPHPLAVYGVLALLLGLAAAAALLVGRGDLSDEALRPLLLSVRGGRSAAAFVAGAALAVGGVMVQGLFRNPLASPSVLGTTAGASLGGHVALLAFQHVLLSGGSFLTPERFLPLGCVLGALAALSLLMAVVRVRDDLVVLLLTGFLLSSLFISLGGFITSVAQDEWDLGRAMVVFALGDVSSAGPAQVLMALPLLISGVTAAWLWGRSLDAMLSGEEEAAALGVEVETVRRWVVVWTALLTGGAVAVGGSVGFVGLIVPHVLRPFTGVAHRRLVPAAALLGGGFVVACDVVCRALPSRTEVPLGVVTGIIGAPLFIALLIRSRRQARHA
jgi:iron complex transport system permease protein